MPAFADQLRGLIGTLHGFTPQGNSRGLYGLEPRKSTLVDGNQTLLTGRSPDPHILFIGKCAGEMLVNSGERPRAQVKIDDMSDKDMTPPSSASPAATAEAAPKPTAQKLSIGRLLPLFVLIAGMVAFFAFGGADYLSFDSLSQHRQELLQWTQNNQALAIIGFILAYALVVAFSLPGATWMTLAGGFLFGTVLSTALVVTAATLGAVARTMPTYGT